MSLISTHLDKENKNPILISLSRHFIDCRCVVSLIFTMQRMESAHKKMNTATEDAEVLYQQFLQHRINGKIKEAADCLRRASSLNHAKAMYRRGKCQVGHELGFRPGDSAEWFRKSYEIDGSPKTFYAYYDVLSPPVQGLCEDEYRFNHNKGDLYFMGMDNLGNLYGWTMDELEKRRALGLKQLCQYAEEHPDDEDVCVELLNVFYGDEDQNYELALKYAERGARLGSALCQHTLARCLLDNITVVPETEHKRKNLYKAWQWWKKADAQTNDETLIYSFKNYNRIQRCADAVYCVIAIGLFRARECPETLGALPKDVLVRCLCAGALWNTREEMCWMTSDPEDDHTITKRKAAKLRGVCDYWITKPEMNDDNEGGQRYTGNQPTWDTLDKEIQQLMTRYDGGASK